MERDPCDAAFSPNKAYQGWETHTLLPRQLHPCRHPGWAAPQPLEPTPGASGPVHPFTCRHEEDAGTKDDVVSGFVELAGCNAESTHEKQNHTQDRENTRGSNSPCRGEREGRAERTTQV